jgi:hypothetical protein
VLIGVTVTAALAAMLASMAKRKKIFFIIVFLKAPQAPKGE